MAGTKTGTVTPSEEIIYHQRSILEPLYRLGLVPHDGLSSGTITFTFTAGALSSIVYVNTLTNAATPAAFNPASSVVVDS